MHRIDHITADNGTFTNGNLAGGVVPTVITADWANALQEEICSVIEGFGIVLDKEDNAQLLAALVSHFSATSSASQLFSISDYGAVGNNIADDTDAINDAIAAAVLANGGKIAVPSPGIGWKTTDNIELYDGCILEGTSIPSQHNYSLYGDGYPTCAVIRPTGDVRRAVSMTNLRGAGVQNIIIDMSGVTAAGNGNITGLTASDPVVVTAISHGRTNGDIVTLTNVNGMTEVNDKRFVVTVVDTDHFALTGVDGTGYTAYTSGGFWTLNPCGLVVEGGWHFDVRNIMVVNLPNNNCIGQLYIASGQGVYWGMVSNVDVYSDADVGIGHCFQGVIDAPRVNQIICSNIRANNVNDGIICDECGGGLIFLNPTSEGNAGDGLRVTNNSTTSYPVVIGGELNTNGYYGCNGLVTLINPVRASGNKGGTGIADDDYWLANGAMAEYLDSTGRKIFTNQTRSETLCGGYASVPGIAASDTIQTDTDIVSVSSSGGEVVMTSNPVFAAGTRGQLLTVIGKDSTDFITLVDGNGVNLGVDRLSIKEGDIVQFRYFDTIGVTALNNKWIRWPFILGNANPTNVSTHSAALAVKSHHEYMMMTTAGANKTVTLPLFASTPKGKRFYVSNEDGLANVTVNGNGTNINGASTKVLSTQYAFVEVIRASSEWRIINQG